MFQKDRGPGMKAPNQKQCQSSQQDRYRGVWSWTAMDMFEAIDNSNPIATTADSSIRVNDADYFLCSVPVALGDYRWDQLMVGIFPETLTVKNCRNFFQLYSNCGEFSK